MRLVLLGAVVALAVSWGGIQLALGAAHGYVHLLHGLVP
jgi:hypothetical protein